ncbi:MAG: leucine-rich repeat domain-containing protein [Clostridia bacterium]|nr:leucine-rich repeat domain-containing protein [Clostridia bacterium]
MKKKILLSLIFVVSLICILSVTTFAEAMTQYCDVKITTTKNEELTCYMKVEIVDDASTINRNKLYKTTDTSGGELSWSQVLVFDMRETEYVGCDTAEFVKGTSCNNYASKVKEVYLPEGLKKLPKSSFTSAWASLQTVYIPSSLEIIDTRAFYQSNVKNVIFKENSNLFQIGKEAFAECSNLASITLPENLESIEENAFYQSGLKKTFVVPNSVTYIGNAAFRKTKIETIVFGDGELTLGENIVGDDSINREYLKNVYLSIETTFVNPSETWFKSTAGRVNFYVVSRGDQDASEFIALLKQTGRGTIVTEKEYANAPSNSYLGIIYETANMCDAFYNGKHVQPEGVELYFADALSEFYEAQECIVCRNFLPVGEFYAPILEFVGYSTRENGTGLCAEYKLNNDSYAKYAEYREELKLGVIISIVENIENLNLVNIDTDGKITPVNPSKTAVADVSKTYKGFSVRLDGFNSSLANLNFVLCAYSYDGEKITYLSDVATNQPKPVQINK